MKSSKHRQCTNSFLLLPLCRKTNDTRRDSASLPPGLKENYNLLTRLEQGQSGPGLSNCGSIRDRDPQFTINPEGFSSSSPAKSSFFLLATITTPPSVTSCSGSLGAGRSTLRNWSSIFFCFLKSTDTLFGRNIDHYNR
jgi:hypothetical protein